MKVLMIAPTPFFSDRGCHVQIYEEIRSLKKLGNEIVLCTYGLGRDLPEVNAVRTLRLPWYKKTSAGPSWTKFLLLPLLFGTALRETLKFKPDVIHAHLHEGAVIARGLKFLFPNKKYLFDFQGSLQGELLAHRFVQKNSLFFRFYGFLEKMINSWFFVITQSKDMVQGLVTGGCNPDRVRNVMDGVDTDIFSPSPPDVALAKRYGVHLDKPRVLFMGLLEEYQGADLLVEAFSQVVRSSPEAQLLVIGYPHIEKYKSLCASRGIKNAIFFGQIPYEKLPSYLSLSPIAIAPKISPTEGDGKIYNYMAMGMATVAFDRSVSREILGETGMFAEMKNAQSLAEKINELISNPDRTVELGKAARERSVKHLSWDAVGRRINEVYHLL